MHTTIFYDHITLIPHLCEEDLKIFRVKGEGELLTQTPVYKGILTGDEMYRLRAGQTYVLGPHYIQSIGKEYASIKSTYNIYKVLRIVPSVPNVYTIDNKSIVSEVIEVEATYSSNQLNYLNFLYGG